MSMPSLPELGESGQSWLPFYEPIVSRPWHTRNAGKPCIEDEEAHHGFWGASSPFYNHDNIAPVDTEQQASKSGCWFTYDFWSFLSVIIFVSCVSILAMDLGFSRYGMGRGLADWIVHGNTPSVSTGYQMRFCLTESNRDAPGPQRWRYMLPTNYENCATETIKMRADSSEQWKLLPDDEILIGNNWSVTAKHDKSGGEGKALHNRVLEELDDDFAEEGRLGRPLHHPSLKGVMVYMGGKR